MGKGKGVKRDGDRQEEKKEERVKKPQGGTQGNHFCTGVTERAKRAGLKIQVV